MSKSCYLLALFMVYQVIPAQDEKVYQYRSVMFYNVENLFDTINNPHTLDDSFTPSGKHKWNQKRYNAKLARLAEVIGGFYLNENDIGPDILGLCEVENITVIRDLIRRPSLLKLDYGIIHKDSPDRRGIDVCFLYKKSCFNPINFKNHALKIYDEYENREYTRDQLVVQGFLDDQEIYVIVNHWPSRRGGEARSRPYRKAAAQLTKNLIDSIRAESPDPKIMIMGDFNDNPLNSSFKHTLKANGNPKLHGDQSLYNPMERLYRKGIGSLAYRDRWELFDQILITKNLLLKEKGRYTYWKTGVFMPEYLLNQTGRYRLYPYRTYAGGTYQGGYSDHLPVYLVLIREFE